uniref:PiggyBac transposable element-derived protein domain-containing protein n=1 Tax=Clastoptera arizonana TaxID=38151 RepID=A0A1B6DXT5_9HEMI
MDEDPNQVENIDSDDDNNSYATTNQEFEEDDLDYDPDFDANPLTWSLHTNGMRQLDFTKNEGLRVPVPDNNPIDFFLLLLDVVFLEGLVKKTNAYALELFCGHNTTSKSRITKWKDVTVDELKIFIALLFNMGINQKARIQDYWRKMKTFIPVYGKFMARDRFLLILRCLNFDMHNPDDRLSKIRYCVDYFNNKMMEIFTLKRIYPSMKEWFCGEVGCIFDNISKIRDINME